VVRTCRQPSDSIIRTRSRTFTSLHCSRSAQRACDNCLRPMIVPRRLPGQYDAATESFQKVIQLAPTRMDGYFYLGASYLKERQIESAVGAWQQAVHLDPQYFPSMFAFGALLGELGRYDAAKPYLQAALTQRPKDPAAELEMGRVYFQQGKLEDALKLLQSATQQNPKSQQASFFLAKTYQKLGKRSAASAEFSRTRLLLKEDAAEAMLTEATQVDHETVQ
jgi:tetratricopeptide (TPR) repeat protein